MKTLLALVALASACPALAGPLRPRERDPEIEQVQQSVEDAIAEDGKRADAADRAFDTMFRLAAKKMRRQGDTVGASEVEVQWAEHKGMLAKLGDAGDHRPFSEWVRKVYAKIEARLGKKICDFTHLSDIWVLNETIRVTFQPKADSDWCAETLAKNPADTCRAEYRRHFAGTKWQKDYDDPYANPDLHTGFSPVVVFWGVFAACEASLWGTDGTLLCSPVSTGAEILDARRVAPGMAGRIWDRRNS